MCNERNGASTFHEGYGSIYKADRGMGMLDIFDLIEYILYMIFCAASQQFLIKHFQLHSHLKAIELQCTMKETILQ
jgi:hypothetical protein